MAIDDLTVVSSSTTQFPCVEKHSQRPAKQGEHPNEESIFDLANSLDRLYVAYRHYARRSSPSGGELSYFRSKQLSTPHAKLTVFLSEAGA